MDVVRGPEVVLRHVGLLGFSVVGRGRRRGTRTHHQGVRVHHTAADVGGRGRHLEAAFLRDGPDHRLDVPGGPHHGIDVDHRVVGRPDPGTNIECLSVCVHPRKMAKSSHVNEF